MATKRQAGEATGRKKAGTSPKAKAVKPKATASKAKGKAKANGKGAEDRTRSDHPGLLERGDIFFFYRPDVEEEAPERLLDVQRFQIVLRPERKDRFRVITVGRKKLPETGAGGGGSQVHWAFVDRVFDSPDDLREFLGASTYETETQGTRHQPSARPAGEGVYALAKIGRESQLAYALELPEAPGEVQDAFNIEPEARLVVSLKNPRSDSPAGAGLDADRQADYPDELLARFGDRKWLPVESPELLDYEGAEMVLIGGDRADAGDDLGIDLDPQPEDEEHAEVFNDLHLEKSDRTLRPLFEGTWE